MNDEFTMVIDRPTTNDNFVPEEIPPEIRMELKQEEIDITLIVADDF